MRDYSKIPPIPDSIWKNPIHFIAFGFGIGAIPIAPGTFGTLAAIPFYLLLSHFSSLNYAIATVILCILSIWVCSKATNDIQIPDHQGMCLDEFIGFFVTMLFCPSSFVWILGGFILFRIFDILKPWPIYIVDKNFEGGFGIILDDVLAGIYSCLCLHLFSSVFG